MAQVRDVTRARITSGAIGALRDRVYGDVILPDDPRYDAARRVLNVTVDRYPALIVRAADAYDVILGIEFARDHDLPLAVRSGGHSASGLSTTNDGVVVDLSRMNAIDIDPEHATAHVQPGATSADLAGHAQPYGLALSTGDSATVGVGGLTLGGGIGWLVRAHGLTIDNLRAVEVATADGRLLTASADEHADLFWALRGGGGNFGIATRFEFQLRPVGTVLGGVLILPASREVIEGYLAYAPQADERLTTIADLMRVPPLPFVPEEQHGELAFVVMVCFVGPADEGQRALEPLCALATPIAEMVAPLPYPEMFAFTEAGTVPHGSALRAGFADTLPPDAIDAMLAAMENPTSPLGIVQLRGLGGEMARVPADATAFAHRDRALFVAIVNVWMDPAEDAAMHRAWVTRLWDAIRPAASGTYVNFLDDDGEERIHEAYPDATFRRLAEVKRTYDPDNVFRLNQNIPPMP